MLKTLFGDNDMGKIKTLFKRTDNLVSPGQVTHMKMQRKYAQSSNKTDKVTFWRLLAG
jgi:hypothetical protein